MVAGRKTVFWICLLLAGATLALYAPAIGHGFVHWDDDDYVLKNPVVQGGLTLRGLEWACVTTHACNWHPLTWLSHMLDCQLFGLDAGGHHLTSILLHALNAVLLFLVLRQMTGATWRSALVAALFALHPLHVESVAWISERKDVLCALFWILTLSAYTAFARQQSRFFYWLAVALYALGLTAKPMLVTLPFVLLLLDYWPLRRRERIPSLLCEKIPYFLLAAASCAATFIAQKEGGAVIDFIAVPAWLRFENAATAYVAYAVKMFRPVSLAAIYPFQPTIPAWKVGGALALLGVFTALTVARARRQPYLPVGWFWYLGTLVPVIGLIQVGGCAMADRYTYLPSIGLFVIVAWSLPDWRSPAKINALVSVCMAGLGALALVSHRQIGFWRDSVALFENAVRVSPDSFVAATNAGSACSEAGKFEEAIAHYTAALQIKPDDAQTHNNLGAALRRLGKRDDAIVQYRKALEAEPARAEAKYNLAVALAERGDSGEAITQFMELLQAHSDFARAHYRLGLLLDSAGRHGEAAAHYRQALALNPNDAEVTEALKKNAQPAGKTQSPL